MLTLTSLAIWLGWEQAGSGGSGFAGSKLLPVDWASLVGGKNNRRVKYPMLVMVMVVMVMVLVVMVMAVMMMVVVEMTTEKRGLMQCMQYEKFASFCNSILHMVTPA